LGAGDGQFYRGFVGQQHAAFGLAGGRVENVLAAAAACNTFAVDKVTKNRRGHSFRFPGE
jgi:hypothetical protein